MFSFMCGSNSPHSVLVNSQLFLRALIMISLPSLPSFNITDSELVHSACGQQASVCINVSNTMVVNSFYVMINIGWFI